MGKSRRSRSDSSSSGTESETGSLSDSDSNNEGEITARSISKSPRPQSTVVVKRDITNRSRKDSRQYLSKFYKERFGSHSPDEYVNLRLSNFDMKLSKDEIRRHLEEEFKELAPFEIKVVRNPDDDRRLAYVNFTKRDSAKYVRQNMISSLQHYLGKNLFVDPAGVLRDQEGKYIPDRYNRALQAQHENRSPNRNGRKDNNRNGMNRRVVGSMPTFNLKQGDSDATRTLFVGNMPADISESEIRKTFEQYGVIEDIDIKNPADTNAAYAFVLFQKLQSAIDALKNEHDKSIRPNSNKIKIGYGKSQPSSRLWIGGLGPWASIDLLLKAFEKFGIVEVIDYKEGDDIAYIKFDSQSAAFEAFNKMKGYTFDRPDTHILVDYAKEDTNRLKIHSLKKDKDPLRHDRHRRSREHSRSRSSSRSSHRGHTSTSTKRDTRKRGHSISSDSSSEIPVRKKHHTKSPTDKTTADLRLSSLEELQKKLAATWIGKVTIKKQEYMIKGYRIAGEEKLVQTVLRDEMGIPHLLKVTQRLPLKNRENLTDRFLHQPYNRIAVMIATEHPNTDYPLYKLREYFHEKDAAGLVTVDETGGMVYVVPPSEVSDETLTHFAPGVTFVRPGVNCLMIVIGQQETFTDGLREE